MWEHYHHQADIGVRGIGLTLEEAFAEAACALMAVMCNPQKVRPQRKVGIECSSPEDDLLLADWLNALLFEMETRNMLFSRFEVHIGGEHLSATAWGEPADPERHEAAVQVKAATYMDLKTGLDENGNYFAQCVVDV